MKSMRAEVIGTFDESAGGVMSELNPSEFDRITEWVCDSFTKGDLEDATNVIIPTLLEDLQNKKRAADIMVAVARSRGLQLRGPKRLKMMVMMMGCLLARKNRESMTATTPPGAGTGAVGSA